MSKLKSIKVDEEVHHKLKDFRDKDESYSDAINRLLLMREGLVGLINVLEGQKAYAESKAKKLEGLQKEVAGRDSAEVPYL